MHVLALKEIKPGMTVWLENNGLAFKELRLNRARVILITGRMIYLFPFIRLPLSSYNKDLTWRCWDDEPDIDSVCETEWIAA